MCMRVSWLWREYSSVGQTDYGGVLSSLEKQEWWETPGHCPACHLRCLPQVCRCCASYNNLVIYGLLVTSGLVGFMFLLLF